MPLKETLKRIQFQGHLDTDAEKTAPVLVTAEYEVHDPSHLDVELAFLGNAIQQRYAAKQLDNLKYDYILVRPVEHPFLPLEVFGLRGLTLSRDKASTHPEHLQYGILDTPSKGPCEYYVSIQLQPSGILSKWGTVELSDKGDIKVGGGIEGTIELTSPLGKLLAEETFSYYESEEFGNEVTHRVRRVTISGTLRFAEGNSLKSSHEKLIDVTNDVCKMLSICYRQPVDWYHITYLPKANQGEGFVLPERFVRRRISSTQGRLRQDELINYRNLVNGGLDRLVPKQANTASRHG